MPTPSKIRRLNEAADYYIMFHNVAMHLCQSIKGLHGGLRFEGEVDTPEKEQARDTALAVAQAIEVEFHRILDPYVLRLEEIDRAIKDNLPKPPGSIILPGENN